MRARRLPRPSVEGEKKGRRRGVAQLRSDARHTEARLFQAGERKLAPQGVLDGAKARAFFVQTPVQGTRRDAKLARELFEAGSRRERLGKELAHRSHHLAIAPVKERDLSRCTFE